MSLIRAARLVLEGKFRYEVNQEVHIQTDHPSGTKRHSPGKIFDISPITGHISVDHGYLSNGKADIRKYDSSGNSKEGVLIAGKIKR